MTKAFNARMVIKFGNIYNKTYHQKKKKFMCHKTGMKHKNFSEKRRTQINNIFIVHSDLGNKCLIHYRTKETATKES